MTGDERERRTIKVDGLKTAAGADDAVTGAGPDDIVSIDADRAVPLVTVRPATAADVLVENGRVDVTLSGNAAGNLAHLADGGDARRSGGGDGDAVRDGRGDGDATRFGDGRGAALRGGAGRGGARRYDRGEGNAVRTGAGDGTARRAGPGHGDAVREGGGAGDAVREGTGDGDALKHGSGEGETARTGTGMGLAIRSGAKGRGRRPPAAAARNPRPRKRRRPRRLQRGAEPGRRAGALTPRPHRRSRTGKMPDSRKAGRTIRRGRRRFWVGRLMEYGLAVFDTATGRRGDFDTHAHVHTEKDRAAVFKSWALRNPEVWQQRPSEAEAEAAVDDRLTWEAMNGGANTSQRVLYAAAVRRASSEHATAVHRASTEPIRRGGPDTEEAALAYEDAVEHAAMSDALRHATPDQLRWMYGSALTSARPEEQD